LDSLWYTTNNVECETYMRYLRSPNLLGTYTEGDTSIEIMENYETTDCGQQIKFYTLRIIHENRTEFPTQTSAEQSLKKVFERVRNS